MSYVHKGLQPIEFYKNPMDHDSTDWIYFSYENWLREGEYIVASSATVSGGELVTDSVHIGTIEDSCGTEHSAVYAVQVTPSEGSTSISVTHRVTTATVGFVTNLGRTDMDRTVVINVETL